MNNTFNPARFGKYFLHDLRNAKNNYWLALLITGCAPVLGFICYRTIFLLTGGVATPSVSTQISVMITALFAILLTFPVKVYGDLTEKKTGSEWLMIPASSFEKWLSMILISCVVLPVCFYILLFGTDAILAALFPSSWPAAAFGKVVSLKGLVTEETEGLFKTDGILLLFAEWPESILVFLLGAICFKKGKVGKTILVFFLFWMIVSGLVTLFGLWTDFNIEVTSFTDADAVRILNKMRVIIWTLLAVYTAALMAGVYARIKTLKH